MSGRAVVRVAGDVGLLAVDVPVDDRAADHHAPVRALAAVVRQATEQRSGFELSLVGFESDRIAVQLDIAGLEHRLVDSQRGLGLRRAWHLMLLRIWVCSPEA